MAYNQNNLMRVSGSLGGGGVLSTIWIYKSADTYAVVKAANYISNAREMGIQARDLVIIEDTATPATTLANILTVTATTCTMSQTGVVVAE
jgi:hypothetical protein